MMVSSLRKFSSSEAAGERLRIIKLYESHGEKSHKASLWGGKKKGLV